MAAASTTRSVDASLWWDPFSLLLTELENYSPSSDLPPYLVKKLRDNQLWFLETISRFKRPNEKSKEALNSPQINVGSHQLVVKTELKEAALRISSVLCLDEVQAYILVNRLMEQNILAANFVVQEVLHVIMLQYYIERQCLLKCTRQLIVHALNIGSSEEEGGVVKEEARKLISGGLENKLLLVLQDLLSSSYPDHMDGDLFSLWAEQTLIEDNLILDILFLAYYESYCTCSGKQWRELCLVYEMIITGSSNFPKLAISAEALQFINHAKVQLLLILIETLDLENLLQMVHDGTPFRTASASASASFTLSDIQDVDSIISNFNAFEGREAGPLILAWAVFLCLISSLPKTKETNMLSDFDHVAYVRQSFEAAALNCVDDILQSDILKDSDGPFAGYRSVLRTFISAFIASYEISLQLEDSTLILILDILCKIYQGEESLCMQFWDRDSFIDGPIRCLLCNLEGEFPYRTVELIRLLSALCEGTWPAECVYNFLDKSVGVSSSFHINDSSLIDTASQIIETRLPLRVPGVEGLAIPRNTRGHVLKVINENTVLVRWEYAQSGVLVLLLRLAQNLYLDNTLEVLATLNLLSRLVSFNMAICFNLLKIGNSFNEEATRMNRQADNFLSFNVVDIICSLVKKISPDRDGALMMSTSVNILANMLKCFPSHVMATVVNKNIFDVALNTNPFNVRFDGISSGSWLLSGRLANMLLIDCEHNDSCCALTLSVLEFTMQLVETEVVNDVVLALLVFSLQYVFVNHTFWKYKIKHARWKVTLKVLEMIKKCISSIPYCGKIGEVVRDLLFCDSSIHHALLRILCITSQDLEKLYVSRFYEMMEIEGIQLSISAAMDILCGMLSNLSQDLFPSLPVFHQTVWSSATKPIPVTNAMISLLSCFRYPKIQVGAAKVLSILFGLADSSQSFVSGNICFGLDEKQITHLRQSINIILCEESSSNEDLAVATLKLLAAATHYQPAFLVALIAAKGNTNILSSYVNGGNQPNETGGVPSDSMEPNIMIAVVKYVTQSGDLFSSKPHVLLSVLNFLEGLWHGAAQFNNILEWLRNSDNFWRHVSNILQNATLETNLIRNSREMDVHKIAYRCQCHSAVLQILTYESFLQKKLLLAEQKIENKDAISKLNNASLLGLREALLKLHESSVLGNLIKSYGSCRYDNDISHRGKSAAALFIVHVMEKLKAGDIGSLSVSLSEKIYSLLNKLMEVPAFSELVAQYAHLGYSEGNKLQCLILQDLYYHLEGELEGREVAPGPFKELCLYLLGSDLLKIYQHKYEGDIFLHGEMMYLYDLSRLRTDLGLDIWDYSKWKASKIVAESMFLCLENVNSMLIIASSSLSALKSLTTVLITVMEDSDEMELIIGKTVPTQLILSSIDQVCHYLQETIDLLAPRPDASEDIIRSIEAQAELLLHLIKFADKNMSSPMCVLILKTSGSGLKLLSDLRAFLSCMGHGTKLLLMLFLSPIKINFANSGLTGVLEMECADASADVSNLSLGLLPILCNCIESDELCILSLTIIDFILRGFTMPNSWLPIIKKHLNVQHLILKLRDKSSLAPVILKFLLTLARVRDGAAMLFTAGFLPSLSTLFGELTENNSLSIVKGEKKEYLWRHGLAVIAAMIHSLQDTPFCTNIVDYVIIYFFLEKVELISYYLAVPDFADYDEKRAWSQKNPTSLSALKDKENTLLLICELAKHSKLWMKSMKQIDSELREKNIHLLAFISRGNQHFRENILKTAPLVCQPILKEEFELFKKPSFVNSRRGWFALSSLGCGITPILSSVSSKGTALIVKEQINQSSPTYFSDIVSIKIYRISLLVLKFLCLQAESAVKRAEEVGFVDLENFPELPMPEILHGLQDQGISIVTELCEANKMKQVPSEVQGVCILLVHTTEMSLYLEYCVSQICGIRPVSGHVEDFSKKLRLLFKVTEGHAFLKGLVQSLRNIVSYVYPGLLQTEGFL